MNKAVKEQKKLSESMYHELLDVAFKYGNKGMAHCSVIITLVACVGTIADADREKMDLILDILLNELELVGTRDLEQVASVFFDETVH